MTPHFCILNKFHFQNAKHQNRQAKLRLLFNKTVVTNLKNSLAESFTTSETDRQSLCQKVRQRTSVIKTKTYMFPENWHFNSHFVLKTTKTPAFVFITEIL